MNKGIDIRIGATNDADVWTVDNITERGGDVYLAVVGKSDEIVRDLSVNRAQALAIREASVGMGAVCLCDAALMYG